MIPKIREKYDYNNNSKKEELLSPEKKIKNDSILKQMEQMFQNDSEEEIYGPVNNNFERVKLQPFKEFLATIGSCQTEGYLTVSNQYKEIIEAERVFYNNEPNGEDALASVRVSFNDKLRVPWLPRLALFDVPFQVAYRRNQKKHLTIKLQFSKNFKVAELIFVIREI